MEKDYELVGKAVKFAPHHDGWYCDISEKVVESYRGLRGIIKSVEKDDLGNTSVIVEWDKPTPGLGKYFRTGFGGATNCSCQDCELQRNSDLELLVNDA